MPGYIHEAPCTTFPMENSKQTSGTTTQTHESILRQQSTMWCQRRRFTCFAKRKEKTGEKTCNPSMLQALSIIAPDQANPTEATWKKIKPFLDCADSYPDALVTHRASTVILADHNDASYLSKQEARSRAGGHFYLSEDKRIPPNNHCTEKVGMGHGKGHFGPFPC